MGITFRPGQALSSLPLNSGSLVAQSTILSTPQDPRSVRIQAVYWSKPSTGTITLYDREGIQIYTGSTAGLTAIHASLNYITVTTPIKYTITGVGNAGSKIILYGEII